MNGFGITLSVLEAKYFYIKEDIKLVIESNSAYSVEQEIEVFKTCKVCKSLVSKFDLTQHAEWHETLIPEEDRIDCTCGYGGQHEPLNRMCERNTRTNVD